MIPFDGNNSMKRMRQLGLNRVHDPRPFIDSDYLLPPEYVDQYADEVASRRGLAVQDGAEETNDGQNDWEDIDEDAAESTNTHCTRNWKAAAADEKKMWGVFEETGYFVSACWHSLILWFSDMIHSGEL
jgi:Kyakuja-Dileera-Zisupton transposase